MTKYDNGSSMTRKMELEIIYIVLMGKCQIDANVMET
jgi:hypothetical protein